MTTMKTNLTVRTDGPSCNAFYLCLFMVPKIKSRKLKNFGHSSKEARYETNGSTITASQHKAELSL